LSLVTFHKTVDPASLGPARKSKRKVNMATTAPVTATTPQ
jgi:hypothetical protein